MTDWIVPASHPGLEPGAVHLWRILLDREPSRVERCAGRLSSDEQARMQRYRFETHQQDFALRRGAMRTILGRYLGIEARDIAFQISPRGKPELAERLPGHRLRFNLSDSKDLALLGVTLDADLGVDVEHLRDIPEMDAVARKHFSAAEYEAYVRLDPSDRWTGFYNCWTRKEAWLKASGEGLIRDLSSFAVSLVPEELPRLLWVENAPEEALRWSLLADRPLPDYVAAVAIELSPPELVRFAWREED
jgi:4'-phosphopantetheinyl transferase